MKIVLAMLFLSVQFAAQPKITTLAYLHSGCEARARAKNHAAALEDYQDASLTLGYITGFVDAAQDLPGIPAQYISGEIADATCKYIDLHPELWNQPRADGLHAALRALYGEKS
jgi:hypothetical protein